MSDDLDLEQRTFTLPDGRSLEVHLANWNLVGAAPDAGPVLVDHHGTPSWGRPTRATVTAAAERGVRIVAPTRAGYGTSTRKAGRTVGDVAADVEAVLDQLGIEQAVVIGGSGGGPHSLATAALLPGRIAGATTIAGVGPYGADDLDFLAGMGQDNLDEFGAAVDGEATLFPYLESMRDGIAGVTAEQIAQSLASLLPPVDRAVLTGPLAQDIVDSFSAALALGVDGWADDDLAFTRPWGFELAALTVPVFVWQGALDLMVPAAHGAWLASHVPTAVAHQLPDDGHLSIAVTRMGEILDELLDTLN